MKIDRRELMGAAALTTLSLTIPGCSRRARISVAEACLAALLDTLAVMDPVAIGEAYLASAPGSGPERLLGEIFTDLPIAAGHDAIAKAFSTRARRQFESGEMVHVAGWYLARCEASLCALLAVERLAAPA